MGRDCVEHIRELGGDEREPTHCFPKPTDAIVPLNDAALPTAGRT